LSTKSFKRAKTPTKIVNPRLVSDLGEGQNLAIISIGLRLIMLGFLLMLPALELSLQ